MSAQKLSRNSADQKKELPGKHFTIIEIFSSKDRTRLMKNFKDIISGDFPLVHLKFNNRRGREVPIECSAALGKK